MLYLFQICTLILVIVSFYFAPVKTIRALSIALKKFLAIAPSFVIVIICTSVIMGFLSPSTIRQVLGASSNRWIASGIASVIGSVAVMPGFIAFPLGGILRTNGVPFMVLSAFTTTLMMVGIVTFPIEKKYLGSRVALIRNGFGFLIALAVAIVTGIVFGEITL